AVDLELAIVERLFPAVLVGAVGILAKLEVAALIPGAGSPFRALHLQQMLELDLADVGGLNADQSRAENAGADEPLAVHRQVKLGKRRAQLVPSDCSRGSCHSSGSSVKGGGSFRGHAARPWLVSRARCPPGSVQCRYDSTVQVP